MGYYYFEWRIVDDSRFEPWVRSEHSYDMRKHAEDAIEQMKKTNNSNIEFRIRKVG